MRVVCPSCDAAYDVPERLLGQAPRRLRCKRCGHEWLLDPTAGTPSGIDISTSTPTDLGFAAPAAPADMERAVPLTLRRDDAERRALHAAFAAPRTPEPKRRGNAAVVGWALTAIVLAGAVYLAITRRDAIMAAWPPSQRVYAILGVR